LLNFTTVLVSKYGGTVTQDLNPVNVGNNGFFKGEKTALYRYLDTVSADALLSLELRLLPEEGPLAVALVLAGIIPVHRER
jgi:hypothetical protein